MPKTWTGSEWRSISANEANDLHGSGHLVANDDASDTAPVDYKGPLAPRAPGAPVVPNAARTSAHGDPFDPRGTPTQLPVDQESVEREKRGMPGVAHPAPAPAPAPVPAPVPERSKK